MALNIKHNESSLTPQRNKNLLKYPIHHPANKLIKEEKPNNNLKC